jgi:2,3-bisphosphoglycerate-dependent phosphoglycerate mutase
VNRLVLVKHAIPVLDAGRAAREWELGPEGERQAADLAGRLRPWLPFRLISSPEPKAARTAEIVADALGIATRPLEGLQEFDRPALPIMPPDEHARLNAEIFARPGTRVLGAESAHGALARFRSALLGQVAEHPDSDLVVISHGTVIALFIADHNPVDAFSVWKRLQCAGFAVLKLPRFDLLQLQE